MDEGIELDGEENYTLRKLALWLVCSYSVLEILVGNQWKNKYLLA